jgi:hypothetical protein
MDSGLFRSDWRSESPNLDPKYRQTIVTARREIDLADHLVYVTLPLTDDVKFLLAVVEHIFNASNAAVESMLDQLRYYKKLEAFPRSFNMMVDLWSRALQEKYGFERKHADFLRRMSEMKHALATNTMRFKRKDKYILTNDVYNLKVLDIDTVKKYLAIAKDFVDRSENIIKKEDVLQNTLSDQ